MKKYIWSLCLFITALAVFTAASCTANAEENDPDAYYLFVSTGCPHCSNVEDYIVENNVDQNLNINIYNTSEDSSNIDLYYSMIEERGEEPSGVPTLIAGEEVIVGDTPIIDYFNSVLGNSPTLSETSNQISDQTDSFKLFVSAGCPHCSEVEKFITSSNLHELVEIEILNTSENTSYAALMTDLLAERGYEAQGVPTLVAGDDVVVGDVPIIEYFRETFPNLEENSNSEENSPENRAVWVVLWIVGGVVLILGVSLVISYIRAK